MTDAKKFFNDNDTSTLANICRVAAERFAEHAKTLRNPDAVFSAQDGTLIASRDAANRLADQFERQRHEALDYAAIFDSCDNFTITHDTDDEA